MGRWVPNKPNIVRTSQAFAIPKVNRVIQQTTFGAKLRAPRSSTHTHGSGKPVQGPRLVDTIRPKPLRVTTYVVSRQTGTPKKFAESVHNGARPHIIRAKRATRLKFKSKQAWRRAAAGTGMRPDRNGFVYPKMVLHPGSRRARTFLTTPLKLSARVNGFKYRSVARRV